MIPLFFTNFITFSFYKFVCIISDYKVIFWRKKHLILSRPTVLNLNKLEIYTCNQLICSTQNQPGMTFNLQC